MSGELWDWAFWIGSYVSESDHLRSAGLVFNPARHDSEVRVEAKDNRFFCLPLGARSSNSLDGDGRDG